MNIIYTIKQDALRATLETGRLTHSLIPFKPVFKGDDVLVEKLESVRRRAYLYDPNGLLCLDDLERSLTICNFCFTRETQGIFVDGHAFEQIIYPG